MSSRQQPNQSAQQSGSKGNADNAAATVPADSPSSGLPTPTDVEKQVASQAIQAFEKGNYGECMSHMNKLMKTRKMDCKVVHNMAVAAFYNAQQVAIDELKNGLNTACQMARSNQEPLDGIEDVENAVLFYNQAVLQFYLKQFKTAQAILEKGFQYIEPPDEALAQNVLLLWTELHICTGQPAKALDVLTYLEKGTSNGKSGASSDRGEQNRDGASSDSNDMLKLKILLLKTRILAMQKQLKALRRDTKTMPNILGVMGFSMQTMRAYYEYLRGNPKKGQKFLLPPPKDPKDTRDYVSPDDVNKYVGMLSKVLCPGQSLVALYYNNLACLHHAMRKHFTAKQYFTAAFKENEKLVNMLIPVRAFTKEHKDKKPLLWVTPSRHHEILYNLGIQHLHCNKAQAAFECLLQVVQQYYINPRLWLRIAECCIMHHRESNDDDVRLEKRMKVIQGSVGSGIHKKLIIGPGTGQDRVSSSSEPAFPALTMEFASSCLANALSLLPVDPLDVKQPKAEDSDSGKAPPEPPLVQAPPASPLRPNEVANLRCSILTASAYVSLCLHDYVVALKHCQNLLRQPRLSGAQRYVGNMYMAEALLMSDRIADAIGHLNPDSVSGVDINTVPPPEPRNEQDKNEKGDKDDREQDDKQALVQWIPGDVRKAKAFMQYNLAVCHATRSQHSKASAILKESMVNMDKPLPAQMHYLKIYLELIQGNKKEYDAVVREHFGHLTANH